MLGRIVKFRRGDQYEEMKGRDVASKTTDAVLPTADANSGVETNRQPDVSRDSHQDTTPDDVLTVDRAVENIGFGWFQIKLSLFTGLVWMADAMEMMILSILGPALHCDWMVPPWQQALLTTIVFGGMMLSSGFWGKVCDKYGRRTELLLCSMFTFYFGLLSAMSPNYVWILILRGIVGFGIGGVPQSITLYAEFLPSSTRASCVVLVELFWAVGTCFIVFISIFIMPTVGWRYLLGIAAVPLIVFFAACFWLPESPRFDIARGQPDRAMATLQRVARENGKPMPLGKLVDIVTESDGPVKRGQVKDLLVPELRLTTILLWFIWLTNAFAYYGIVLVTTELFQVDDVCNADKDTQHVTEPACRLECKTLSTKDYTDLLWTTVAEFPGLFITIVIIEYIGRRFTMALEFLVFAFFVLLVNICVARTVLIIFLFIARAFISGGFQASYVYTPEVYPTTIRAMGLGMCSGMARIGALVTPFVAQVLLRVSVHVALTLYSATAIVAGITSFLLPIETKGREMTDTHSLPSTRPPSRASDAPPTR